MDSGERLEFYERRASVCLDAASLAMKLEIPDYGEAERQIVNAKSSIEYARQIRNGTYRGEEY